LETCGCTSTILDAGDRDRKDVLAADRLGNRLHRRIEAFNVADHQRHASPARRPDDLLAL
jgi:uncharacterized cupin superfamily protein